MITQSTNLNLIPGQVLPHINVSQYDYGSRTLEFKLFNGNQSFTLASGMTAKISGTKADMHAFEYAATVDTTNQKIVADLTQQMTAAAGDVTCELIILKSGERLGTCNFIISVEKAALSDDAIISDTELPAIIAEATVQMEAAAASATLSESYAKGGTGTRTGENTDNSRYYKEQAAGSATTASTKAGEASTSATASANQALKSEGYAVGTQNGTAVSSGTYFHNNSKYYAEQADASADRAEAYSVNVPYIGANGNWWVWNTTQGAYVDSGVDASITVQIADITMLAPDATPYVTNSGTDTDPIFHLFIPRGKGISSISKTSTSGLVDTYTITYSDGTTYTYTVTNGKTAYQSAVEGGYTGTELEFDADLANFKTLRDEAVTAASNASNSAISAAGSVTSAHQEYLDAKAQADRAQAYADFIEPHFIIQDNRLYIKDDAVGEFIVVDNRLYMKLIA